MLRSGSAKSSRGTSDDDLPLFDTPNDLLCPITHELFRDPVLTMMGQTYERSAIERAWATGRPPVDPCTGVAVTDTSLLSIYLVKSRAMEYRERAAAACVAHAHNLSCSNPIRYLRRAADLVGDMDVRVPGLSQEVVAYLQSHPSNAYDVLALQQFGEGLRRAGYIESATNVFYKLLEISDDRAQQATALKACIACWSALPTGASSSCPAPKGSSSADGSSTSSAAAGCSDPFPESSYAELVPQLAAFIDQQGAFSAGQIVELMREAKLSDVLILQLCEHLLGRPFQHRPGSSGGASHSNSASSSAAPSGGSFSTQQGAQPHNPAQQQAAGRSSGRSMGGASTSVWQQQAAQLRLQQQQQAPVGLTGELRAASLPLMSSGTGGSGSFTAGAPCAAGVSGAGGEGGTGAGGGVSGSSGGTGKYADLLFRYTQIRCSLLERQMKEQQVMLQQQAAATAAATAAASAACAQSGVSHVSMNGHGGGACMETSKTGKDRTGWGAGKDGLGSAGRFRKGAARAVQAAGSHAQRLVHGKPGAVLSSAFAVLSVWGRPAAAPSRLLRSVQTGLLLLLVHAQGQGQSQEVKKAGVE